MPIKKTIVTRKKVKVIGKRVFVDPLTGVKEEMQVVRIEERDANFHKIWLQHVIMSLDIIGNVKMKFAFWLLEHMTADNLIAMTYEQMARRSGYSYETIKRTMPLLVESDFLIRINKGAYQVNPNVIFKGHTDHRMNVLLQYHQQADENAAQKETDIAGKHPDDIDLPQNLKAKYEAGHGELSYLERCAAGLIEVDEDEEE